MNVQGHSWGGVCTPRTHINADLSGVYLQSCRWAGGDRHEPAQLNQLEALSQTCKVEGD